MTRAKSLDIDVRHVVSGDIPGMLEIEKSRYSELYRDNEASLKGVEDRFRRRIEVAKEWMWVAVIDKQVTGFITGQPTDSEPSDFVSWEKSTDNGTLEKTFNVHGKNVYVVNLDVSRDAAKQNVQYMLMAQLGAKSIRHGKDKVVFESRMPGFREYMLEEQSVSLTEWNDLSPSERMDKALAYSKTTTIRNGKKVLRDRLLRFYDSGGFKLEKVFANAFKDPESLDFGMLCTGGNPIPKKLRLPPLNYLVSKLFEKVGKNPDLLSRLVG